MAQISIGLRMAAPVGLFSEVIEVLDHPFAGQRGRNAIASMRYSVRKEFQAGAWSRPEGGSTPWKKVELFGNRPAPATALGGTGGFLSSAWQGGQFGSEEKSDTKVAIIVTHPAAPVHRGGDENPSENFVTTIPITQKMRWKLGLDFGVWMSQEKKEINIPARPHATTNPALEEDLVQAFGRLISAAAGAPR